MFKFEEKDSKDIVVKVGEFGVDSGNLEITFNDVPVIRLIGNDGNTSGPEVVRVRHEHTKFIAMGFKVDGNNRILFK